MKKLVLILSLFLANAAFAAFSSFAVVTPENELEHPFLVQVKAVDNHEDRSRVRVIGAIGRSQHAWLIVCRKYVNANGKNLRNVVWYGAQEEDIEGITRLHSGQATVPEYGEQLVDYVEVELSHEQMRRAHIYIDYPFEVDDGGYYYSIDLAYYLEGRWGKKSMIRWETP